MNKAIKVCLITGIIFCLLGVGTVTTGVIMGGTDGASTYLINRGLWGRDYHTRNSVIEAPFETAPAEVTEGAPSIEAGTFTGIRKLELEAGPFHTMHLVEEPRENPMDDTIRIVREEGTGLYYNIRKDGDTLEISIPRALTHKDELEALTVFVPEGFTFREVEIDAKAGDFYAETIQAERLGQLEVDCNAGKIICLAKEAQNIEVDCASGAVEIALVGLRTEYNYEIESKAGSITLSDETPTEYAGILTKKQIHNQATANVELDCKAGKIIVHYPSSSQ